MNLVYLKEHVLRMSDTNLLASVACSFVTFRRKFDRSLKKEKKKIRTRGSKWKTRLNRREEKVTKVSREKEKGTRYFTFSDAPGSHRKIIQAERPFGQDGVVL